VFSPCLDVVCFADCVLAKAVQVGELRCLGYRIPMQFGPEATRKRIAPPPTAPLSPSLRYPERRDCPEFHVSNIKGDCPSDKVPTKRQSVLKRYGSRFL
jgi:hypothetical protein